MKNQRTAVTFTVMSHEDQLMKVGPATIVQPAVDYRPSGQTKWFDDSKLIRRKASA